MCLFLEYLSVDLIVTCNSFDLQSINFLILVDDLIYL